MGNSVVKFLTTETMFGKKKVYFTFIEKALEKYILLYVGLDEWF